MLYIRPSFFLLYIALTMAWSCNAHGQRPNNSETTPETAAAINSYQQTIDWYKDAIRTRPDQVEAYLSLSRAYRTVGRYDDAEAQARKAAEIDSAATAHQAAGELLMLRGEFGEAEKYLQRALSLPDAPLTAHLHLGRLYLETGQKTEAHQHFQTLMRLYQGGQIQRAEDVMAVALAAKYLERFHDANSLFAEATSLAPSHLDAYVAWGYLFLGKYNRKEAAEIFEDALKIDPGYPPALVGLADVLSESRSALAETKCLQALSINPNLIEAYHLLARLYLVDEQYGAAVEQLQKALEVNPVSPATRALLATCYHAMGKDDAFQEECRRVLDVNPSYGQLYATIAENLSRRYRFHEAIEMDRKAIEMDPELWTAYANLGINLSRVGQEEEGREWLDQAFERDSFNTWTYNTLNLFDSFKEYTTHVSDHFVLKLHNDEDSVYGTVALDLLEQAYRTISPRYGFTSNKPILVEIFPKHDDFAVRISGLPGAGALLGVCFGEVIVADSPKARPAGSFNWGQTLWHEFAHVVHLQLTRNRIPRWLAEGIAVYETRIARPEWNIDLNVEFASAVERDDLLKVSELNSGFTRPKSAEQVTLSYYQASIVVDYIVETYGFDAVLTMLHHYNEDKNTEQVIETTFDVSFDEFNEAFLAYAKIQTASARQAMRFTPSPNKELTEADLRAEVEQHPESFYAHLYLGRLLTAQGGDDEAIDVLTKARTLLPNYIHPGNPYRLLVDIYRKRDDDDALIRELEALTLIDEDNIDANKELAQLYANRRQDADVIRVLSRGVMINPFDSKVRNMRGVAYERLQQQEEAITEFQAALAVETTDMVMGHYNLARVYLAANRKAEAKRSALDALEIAPNFLAAQEILLKSME